MDFIVIRSELEKSINDAIERCALEFNTLKNDIINNEYKVWLQNIEHYIEKLKHISLDKVRGEIENNIEIALNAQLKHVREGENFKANDLEGYEEEGFLIKVDLEANKIIRETILKIGIDESKFKDQRSSLTSSKIDMKRERQNNNFIPINTDFSISNRIPFEIELIYNQSYSNERGNRFIKVQGDDYFFYTEDHSYFYITEDIEAHELYTEELEILTYENIDPYYKAYAQGFMEGYASFDEKIKDSTAIFNDDVQSIIKKVFQFITTPIEGLASYGSGWINDKRVRVIKKEFWFESGVKTGEKYKAWFYVINNYSYFINLFRTYKPYIGLYHRAAKYWKNQPGGEGMYSHIINLLKEIGEPLNKEPDISFEQNDFLHSTVEDYMIEMKKEFNNEKEYQRAVQTIKEYFSGPPQIQIVPIFIKRGNKRNLAFALGEVYKTQRNEGITLEYLQFAKDTFTIFKDEDIYGKEINKTNLYKYMTSKT